MGVGCWGETPSEPASGLLNERWQATALQMRSIADVLGWEFKVMAGRWGETPSEPASGLLNERWQAHRTPDGFLSF